jgi:Uma2 family endonuclease
MAERALKRMTLAEFLVWDDGTDTRWELIDGIPVAMALPAVAHGILAVRLAARTDAALRSRSGHMVLLKAGIAPAIGDDTFYVADLAMSAALHGPNEQITREPALIVEILSPSTTAFDRQVKIPDYRCLPSVQEILAIDSVSVFAEVMRREGDRWITEIVQGRDATLTLNSVDLAVSMAELYEGIDIPELSRTRSARRRRP